MTANDFGATVRRQRTHYHGVPPRDEARFKEFLRSVQLSERQLAKIENGGTDPTLSTMNRLARALYFEIQTNA